ncbi:hypothetical protein Pmani_012597 [Petrolisthes manimaculis]|uniref:Uncharacterized protein n=1 Tax=Petrolisthes manimaculis TaxID=1843537 RepID=A0AAE1UEG8_9EUCA|nr:hypothetical protein Pmani_012597 [Petrolisthes manimaculis]
MAQTSVLRLALDDDWQHCSLLSQSPAVMEEGCRCRVGVSMVCFKDLPSTLILIHVGVGKCRVNLSTLQ